MLEHINWYLVDPLLVYNYGEDAAGSVYISTEPLVNEQKELLRGIVSKLLESNLETFQLYIDVDAALDQLGLPKVKTVVTDDDDNDDANRPEDKDKPTDEEVLDASLTTSYKTLLKELGK